jgi:hypothetical protein
MGRRVAWSAICSGRSVKMSRDSDRKVSCHVYSKSAVKVLRSMYTQPTMYNAQFLVLIHPRYSEIKSDSSWEE